jgi:hypothetical protein
MIHFDFDVTEINAPIECQIGKPAAIESLREYLFLDGIAGRACKIYVEIK